MRVYRHYRQAPEDARQAILAIGNFDGVHRGHQTVIARARAIAAATGATPGVLTFEPHARSFFRADEPSFRLTPFHAKARLLAACGVEVLVVCRFDGALAALGAADFTRTVLVDGLAVRGVVVGYDFRFGRGRSGDAAQLTDAGGKHGFAVEVVAPVKDSTATNYSSSTIRDHLRQGRPAEAAVLLGRWWEIEGHVRRGDRRGHVIGFPTANLALGDYLVPATGVYAVRVAVGSVWHDGVANLGTRPTVGGRRLLLEAHLFDFAGDLYGRGVRIGLIAHIRPERRFDGLPALRVQIARDSVRAREILATTAPEPTVPGGEPMAALDPGSA